MSFGFIDGVTTDGIPPLRTRINVNVLECPVCLTEMTHPYILPCGHEFCHACITRHFGGAQQANCPVCRRLTRREEAVRETALDTIIELSRGPDGEPDIDRQRTLAGRLPPIPGAPRKAPRPA